MESKHLAAKLQEPASAERRTNHGMTRALRTSPENTREATRKRQAQVRHGNYLTGKYATEISNKRTNSTNRRTNLAHLKLGRLEKRQL